MTAERIQRHVEEHIGPVARVLHEPGGDERHVDVLVVAPTPQRDFVTLVTSGMSAVPMRPPAKMASARRCEVCICLPPDWPLDDEALEDERNFWPIRWLRALARLPSADGSGWVWEGHTIANGDPPKPFAEGTKLCSLILIRPIHFSPKCYSLKLGKDDAIEFFLVVPLLDAELVLKAKKGFNALLDALRLGDALPVLNPQRWPVCPDPAADPFGNATFQAGRSEVVRRPTPARVLGFALFLPLLVAVWLVASVIVWRKIRQWTVPRIREADFGAALNADAGLLREHESALLAGGFAPCGDFFVESSPAESEAGSGAAVRFYADAARTTLAYVTKVKTGANVLTFFELSSSFDDGFGVCSSSLDSPMWRDERGKAVAQYPGQSVAEVIAAHAREVAALGRGRSLSKVDADVKADFLAGEKRHAERKAAAGLTWNDPVSGITRPTLRGALLETARQWLFMTLGVNPLRRA